MGLWPNAPPPPPNTPLVSFSNICAASSKPALGTLGLRRLQRDLNCMYMCAPSYFAGVQCLSRHTTSKRIDRPLHPFGVSRSRCTRRHLVAGIPGIQKSIPAPASCPATKLSYSVRLHQTIRLRIPLHQVTI